jgi:hypothetical protein
MMDWQAPSQWFAAMRDFSRANDCFGSKAVLANPKHHFRHFTNNGHRQTGPADPLRAISTRAHLFDYLVGAAEQ